MSPAKRPERSGDQKVESSPEQARERKAERLREQHAAVDAVRLKVEAVHTLIGIRPPPEVVGTLFRTDPEFALSLFNVDAYRDDERVAMIGKLLKPVGGSYVSIQYHWYDRDKRCQRSHSDYAAALAARREGQDVSYSTRYS